MWCIALAATLGSLFLSEVLGYVPCTLCWYQRIFMYSLTIILTISLITKRVNLIEIEVLSIAGLLLAFYHYMLQFNVLSDKANACKEVSCSMKYIEWFGFITIPFLSFLAFSLIFIGCIVYKTIFKG